MEVVAGHGAERFAGALRQMEGLPDGVHRLTFRADDGNRHTVFALVGNGSWSEQVRMYVLHPYRMAMDISTGEVLNDSILQEIESHL